ncbi:hypothetical protein HYR99_03410 [Candidatus Poribacteria bacterium]|nr:hypothetical protein [Candidatus Poribacteria bacterium]
MRERFWVVTGLLSIMVSGWQLVIAETPKNSEQALRNALEFLSSSQTHLQTRPPQASNRVPDATEGDANYANLSGDCAECHRRLQPNLVYQWEFSHHAGTGVGCDACHGRNHSQIFRENGAVSAGVCGKCHPTRGEAFANSRHAAAFEALTNSALFAPSPRRGAASGRCNRPRLNQASSLFNHRTFPTT